MVLVTSGLGLGLGEIVKFIGSDEVQLRAPFFLAASVGALGWSVVWLVCGCGRFASFLSWLKACIGAAGSVPVLYFGVPVPSNTPSR